MFKFFFGDIWHTGTTISSVLLLVYILYHWLNQQRIVNWGSRLAILLFFGLIVCCLAVMRDGYHLSVMASFPENEGMRGGLFSVGSMTSSLAMISGALIFLTGLLSIFLKNQRKTLFFMMSILVLFKILLVTVSRLIASK